MSCLSDFLTNPNTGVADTFYSNCKQYLKGFREVPSNKVWPLILKNQSALMRQKADLELKKKKSCFPSKNAARSILKCSKVITSLIYATQLKFCGTSYNRVKMARCIKYRCKNCNFILRHLTHVSKWVKSQKDKTRRKGPISGRQLSLSSSISFRSVFLGFLS